MIERIRICKLEYQDHPFVHGHHPELGDVWLMQDGEWTTDEQSPHCVIPFTERYTDYLYNLEKEVEQLRQANANNLEGWAQNVAGLNRKIKRLEAEIQKLQEHFTEKRGMCNE